MNYVAEIRAFELWLENGNYLPVGAQLLWYRLMHLDNKCGWAEWFAVDNLRLMSMTQTGRKATLIEYRKSLIEAGLIEYQRGKKGCPSRYKMLPVPGQVNGTLGEPQTVPLGVPYTVPQTVPNSVPKTVPINKPKQKPKPKQSPNGDIERAGVPFADDPLLDAAIRDFIADRKERKQPMTDRAVCLLVKELDRLAPDTPTKIAILEQSIARGWKGVFPLKDNVPFQPAAASSPSAIAENLTRLYVDEE